MSADDRDARLEELLRSSLQSEADMITPSGDGLSRIQQRVGTRRSRAFWLRPAAALGALAVIGGAGFAAYALSQRPGPPSSLVSTNPTPTPTPSQKPAPAPTPSAPPVALPTYPDDAIYPFTTQKAEQAWEAQGGPTKQPWVVDPKLLATYFVANYVGQSAVDTVVSSSIKKSSADVTLGRTMSDGNRNLLDKVTTVHLAKYGKAWIVTGASDAEGSLRISTPVKNTTVTSPLTVTGPGFGVDESVIVDVRSLSGDAVTGNHPNTGFGSGTPQWSVRVPFATPADSRGAVIALEVSMADGGPSRLAVTSVRFSSAQAAAYPAYFYGVKSGRITKLSTRDGASIAYLTAPQPGGGASDPQLVGNTVYYLQGGGTCANAVMSVPADGGASTLVTQSQNGYVITGFGISADGTNVASFNSSCSDATTPQGMLVAQEIRGVKHHAIAFPAFPPMVVADPAWDTDGEHLFAIVRTGNMSHVARYDAFTATSWDDSSAVCSPDSAGLPQAIDIDGAGGVWTVGQNGTGSTVSHCADGTSTVVTTVDGDTNPYDLSVASDGQSVLVTSGTGSVWRWNRGGSVTQLHPSVGQPQVDW